MNQYKHMMFFLEPPQTECSLQTNLDEGSDQIDSGFTGHGLLENPHWMFVVR